MEDVDEELQVGGYLLRDKKFADDQEMVAGTEKGMQKILNRLNETAKQYNIKINVKKTKVMKMANNGEEMKIITDRLIVKQMNKFRYLGT